MLIKNSFKNQIIGEGVRLGIKVWVFTLFQIDNVAINIIMIFV